MRWAAAAGPTIALAFVCLAALVPSRARAASLPPHPPLRVLIVSDEVNPHGLSDAELTQPGDISAALQAPGSGLHLDSVVEIATDDLDQATALLSVPIGSSSAYDVVVYFAHRIPNGPTGAQEQADFVAAVEDFLIAGGGFISFHHGSYQTVGKDAIQDLIGATATGAVPWDTVEGQNVIDVAPGHFITTHGVSYAGTVSYEDAARGVPLGTYAYFNNTPDERYPSFDVNPGAGDVTLLFASDYDGTSHLLGFTHRRPAWTGIVIAYQPGEYQPNALDDLGGNNFQVLANSIYFAAYRDPRRVPGLAGVASWLVSGLILLIGSGHRAVRGCALGPTWGPPDGRPVGGSRP